MRGEVILAGLHRVGVSRHGIGALLALAFLLLSSGAHAQHFRFQRMAGGFIGDGRYATFAGVGYPVGVAIDAQGNLYIAQAGEHRVRKVATNGNISTYAGTGEAGFGGDGGPATSARLNSPAGLAVDGVGNLYIADARNRRVRKVAPDGVISTIAGNGMEGNAGDGGPATLARLSAPWGLAIDAAGNLYFSDRDASVVRRVAPDGIISTIAGTGEMGFAGDGGPATLAQLNVPRGVTIDRDGNLLVADSLNHRVRIVRPGGTIATFAGNGIDNYGGDGGPATQAYVGYPMDVAVDPNGNVAIADGYCAIRLVSGGIMSTIAGNSGTCQYNPLQDGGPASQAGFMADAIAYDAQGDLHLVDSHAGRVLEIRIPAMTWWTEAGIGTYSGDGGPATEAMLSWVYGIAVDSKRTLYIADMLANYTVREVLESGTITTVPLGFNGVFRGLDADAADNLFLPMTGFCKIFMLPRTGALKRVAGNDKCNYSGDGGPALLAGMAPYDVAADAHGDVYVADMPNNRVRKFTPGGTIRTVAGTGASGFAGDGGPATSAIVQAPRSVDLDAEGNLYIATGGDRHRIRKVGVNGVISTIAGGGSRKGAGFPAIEADFGYIYAIAVAPDGTLYAAVDGKVVRITPDGILRPVTEPGGIFGVSDVALDADGALYVATSTGVVYRGEPVIGGGIANDFDDDGVSDLFWRNPATGGNAIWPAADATHAQAVPMVSGAEKDVDAIGDFDGDGRSDLFWRNHDNGRNVVWRGGQPQALAVASMDPAWLLAGSGDFDGDGIADILWRNPATGANLLWPWADASLARALPSMPVAWAVAGTGDFDRDGKVDVLWRNAESGEDILWKGADAARQAALRTTAQPGWAIAAIADFDGDGRADIFWYNASNGGNVIWKGGEWGDMLVNTPVLDRNWTPVAAADYNGDGMADILWHNASTGACAVWEGGLRGSPRVVEGMPAPAWQVQ